MSGVLFCITAQYMLVNVLNYQFYRVKYTYFSNDHNGERTPCQSLQWSKSGLEFMEFVSQYALYLHEKYWASINSSRIGNFVHIFMSVVREGWATHYSQFVFINYWCLAVITHNVKIKRYYVHQFECRTELIEYISIKMWNVWIISCHRIYLWNEFSMPEYQLTPD